MSEFDAFAPAFRDLATSVVLTIDRLVAESGLPIHAKVMTIDRSHDRQWGLYRKGRIAITRQGDIEWVIVDKKKIVTNATPAKSPHCIRNKDGTPASCAVDVALLDEDGRYLPDEHPAWAFIPAACAIVDAEQLAAGGMWKGLRDWVHVELAGWRELTEGGVLI